MDGGRTSSRCYLRIKWGEYKRKIAVLIGLDNVKFSRGVALMKSGM